MTHLLLFVHSHDYFHVSDFVYYDHEHLHYKLIPALLLVGLVLFFMFCIYLGVTKPDWLNKPIPPRFLIMGMILVMLLAIISWANLH